MTNVDYKKRTIILSFVCALVIIALVMTFISLFQSLKEENSEPTLRHIYATVLESGNNYIRVSDIDSKESFMFMTRDSYEKGDLVSISYIDDNKDISTKKIELVAKKEELEELEKTEKDTTTTSTTTTTTIESTSSSSNVSTNNSTKKTTTSKKTTTKRVTYSENDVVSFVKNEYEAYGTTYSKEKTIPEKAKSGFITIVDFIFYNGTIKGKRFSELTDAAKAKVIYYALLIDGKIDSKWPDYKNTIKNKTNDIKAKLLAKYMDVTSSVCSKHEYACEVARDDLAILKKSLNITWNVVKDAAKYGYGKITTILKDWYETWRDKE